MQDVDEPVPAAAVPIRIGLIGFTDLRLEGLAAILGAEQPAERFELLSLTTDAALLTTGLELLMVEAESIATVVALVTAIRQARPSLRILVVGPPVDHAAVASVIRAGSKGYLAANAVATDIATAVNVVRDGSIWAPRKVLVALLDHALTPPNEARREPEPELVRFTAREHEVLRLLVLGYPNREIAALMKVDDGTVKAHLSCLMRKAGVENRIALTMRALERGWAGVLTEK